MKTHFILTMGTSILGKYKNKTGAKKNPPLAYPPIMPAGGALDRDAFPAPGMFCGDYEKIAPILKGGDAEGAEQSTIRSFRDKWPFKLKDCQFHIIVTDTTDCMFCAAFLGHDVLKDFPVRYLIPAGLGEATSDKFSRKGLPNLLARVADILDRVEAEGDEAVIIPTGGYKIMVPYLTIASILYKQPAYYLYEGSQDLIELPALPLGIDTSEFRAVMVLLENVIGLNMTQAAPFFEALPQGFRHLVHLTEAGLFQFTAFGLRLRRMYRSQSAASPLRVRAEGNSLMPFLENHQRTFADIARLGETIWLGDKAPEMADHARHHHTNLFAYAELILLPILKQDKRFLLPHELFLLLGMVYLHDCGHSLCTIALPEGENIPLLPTEIRNYHNILGFIRLNSPDFLSTLKRQGLSLDPQALAAIGWISAYHRKKMPLLAGSAAAAGGLRFPPLAEKADLVFDAAPIDGRRLALLASLFRIIDGMDKQVGRAGDAVEISMRAEAILADLPYLRDRANRMAAVMSRAPYTRARVIADGFLEEIVADYGLKESVSAAQPGGMSAAACRGCRDGACGFAIRSPDDFTEVTVFQRMEAALSEITDQAALPLAWEYLAARVRLFFQMLQPVYYHSDLLLGMPRVTHVPRDGVRTIIVDYPENEDIAGSRTKISHVWEEIQKWITLNLPENALERQVLNAGFATPDQIVAGIRDEYCSRKCSEVAEILSRSGIYIEFRHKGAPVPCWKESAGR